MADLTARVHRRRSISAVLLATLVASTSLSVVAASGPTGADQLSSLQAQAATIAQELIQQQLEVDSYQQRYSVVSARLAADSQAIQQIGQQIGQDDQQIAAKEALVRSEAIRSYMDYGTGSGSTTAALFGGDQEHAQAASEYSSIAVGNITVVVDQLHTAQDQLQAHEASLRQQQDQDRADQASQAAALDHADASAGQLASLHAKVTGQLATAVAAEAAAQHAAAVAAVAAAQRQAARSDPARSTTTTPAPVPTIPATTVAGTPTTVTTVATPVTPPPAAGADLPDPALNPFLLCVIQKESGGDYSINTGNGYYGAFQFSQSTWNIAAQDAGLSYLVGVLPSSATKAEQDTVAVALYALDGGRPWTGDCGA
jgi:peptidoglycan hydrolase CwlO-like protein